MIGKIYNFYRDGFRAMVVGRTLWKIIFIKLIVMFGVLKLFFFPDYLQTNFNTDQDRADHVLSVLAQPSLVVSDSENKNMQSRHVLTP